MIWNLCICCVLCLPSLAKKKTALLANIQIYIYIYKHANSLVELTWQCLNVFTAVNPPKTVKNTRLELFRLIGRFCFLSWGNYFKFFVLFFGTKPP